MWQDIVMMICFFLLSAALVPAIISEHKPAKLSCIFTIILLAAILICLATLNMWLSVIAQVLTIIAWTILLVQPRVATDLKE